MASMDIFKADAFSMMELSAMAPDVSYVPQLLGDLGIFQEQGLYVNDIAIEKKGSTLSLIPTSPKGAAPRQTVADRANVRKFSAVRLADSFTLQATEVAAMRAYGSNSELKVVMSEYAAGMSKVKGNMDLTHEHHRLGALAGKLLDADGTTIIYDYFDEFGIAEPAALNAHLDVDTTKVRKFCQEVTRAMARSAAGAFTTATTVHALASDSFFDLLIDHPDVKRTYENWAAAAELRSNIAFQAFPYGGIMWHNYRGTDDLSTIVVPDGEALFFPVNAIDVFKKFMAPADEFMPFVGTKGQDVYAMNIVDDDRQAWTKGELYSYPLYMCTKPQVLRRATAS